MRPGTLDHDNWAGLGQLVIDYWKGKISQAQISADPKAALGQYGCHIPAEIAVVPHFDNASYMHIVFPDCPWDTTGFPNQGNELEFVESMESYRRQLGIVVMGGCR